jgi:hypothetical protein
MSPWLRVLLAACVLWSLSADFAAQGLLTKGISHNDLVTPAPRFVPMTMKAAKKRLLGFTSQYLSIC